MTDRAFEIRGDADGVLWLSGELDLAEASAFPEEAAGFLDGETDAVIDCSGLTFLDSSGIRAIFQLASRSGRGLVLRDPTDTVRKVLVIAGVNGQMGVRVEPVDPKADSL
jgi:anti-anti-sigma factor